MSGYQEKERWSGVSIGPLNLLEVTSARQGEACNSGGVVQHCQPLCPYLSDQKQQSVIRKQILIKWKTSPYCPTWLRQSVLRQLLQVLHFLLWGWGWWMGSCCPVKSWNWVKLTAVSLSSSPLEVNKGFSRLQSSKIVLADRFSVIVVYLGTWEDRFLVLDTPPSFHNPL